MHIQKTEDNMHKKFYKNKIFFQLSDIYMKITLIKYKLYI